MKFTVQNKALTRINRGWLQFNAINGVFDTELYADPRLFWTSEKLAEPLGSEAIKAAQEELIAVATEMGATFLDVPKAKKSKATEEVVEPVVKTVTE